MYYLNCNLTSSCFICIHMDSTAFNNVFKVFSIASAKFFILQKSLSSKYIAVSFTLACECSSPMTDALSLCTAKPSWHVDMYSLQHLFLQNYFFHLVSCMFCTLHHLYCLCWNISNTCDTQFGNASCYRGYCLSD